MNVDLSQAFNWIYIVVIPQLLDWFRQHIQQFEPIQWLLLILGSFLVSIGVYSAWKSYRIASYSVSVKIAKFGFTLIVLAFAWPNIKWIYEEGIKMTGNPVLAFVLILIGGFFGLNVVKLILLSSTKKR